MSAPDAVLRPNLIIVFARSARHVHAFTTTRTFNQDFAEYLTNNCEFWNGWLAAKGEKLQELLFALDQPSFRHADPIADMVLPLLASMLKVIINVHDSKTGAVIPVGPCEGAPAWFADRGDEADLEHQEVH